MTATETPQKPPLILATALILGVLSTAFSAIFLSIALPTIITELGIQAANAHWLITVFITTSTLCMLLVSNLISRFSLKHTYSCFLLIFTVASLIGANCDTFWPLIVCRAAQGSAMGVLAIVALVALYDAYPIEQRGRAGALFGLGMAMGPTLGPTLSGFVVDWWGWRGTFYVPVLLSLTSLIMCWRVLPEKRVASPKKLDKIGLLLVSACLFSLLGGTSYLQQQHWPLLPTLGFGAIVAGLFATLWFHQTRNAAPLLVLSLFTNRGFNAAAIVGFVFGMGLWGSAFVLPLYMQQSLGMSAQMTGLVMLPSGIVMFLIMPFGGRMTDRRPARQVVSLGVFMLGISFVLLGIDILGTGFVALAGLITLSRGIGLGIMIPSLDATATRNLHSTQMTDGLAMMNFLKQLGGTLSPTAVMLMLEWRIRAHNPDGGTPLASAIQLAYDETLLGLGILFLTSLIAAWHLPKTMERGKSRTATNN